MSTSITTAIITTSKTDNNIRLIQQLPESGWRLTVIQIESEVGISYGGNLSMIAGKLGFGKKSDKWVSFGIMSGEVRFVSKL